MNFWKIFFGALLAFIVGSFLVILLGVFAFSGLVASFTQPEAPAVSSNSVLSLRLDYDIPEQTKYFPSFGFTPSALRPSVMPGVNDIIQSIQRAKNDPHIKGIYLHSGYFGGGWATALQIRNTILDFKKSGKFVVSYAEVYTQKSYYLCSTADSIYVNPHGAIEFNGLAAQYMFYKKLFDKLGIEPQVFYDGKFKTATEPYRLDSMSAANKLMTSVLINDIQSQMIRGIADSRNMNANQLDSINKNFLVHDAADAKKYGIATQDYYEDQVLDRLRLLLHVGSKDEIHFVSLGDYMKADDDDYMSMPHAKDQIAVVYADGDIVDGKGKSDEIGDSRYATLLRKLRNDDHVKAVVLRVNSPGGSSLASDNIAREVELTKEKKPVVVSMGDYAASGGYYISVLADKIVAQPTTLTGSIGVFGIWPNLQKLLNDKLGLTFDEVQTGKYSDFGTLTRPLRDDEKAIVQNEIDSIYSDFKNIVVKGRSLKPDFVDSIAQGRVWTGTQGLKLGLVDTLGTLDDAVHIAANLAHTSSYSRSYYPENGRGIFHLVHAVSGGKKDATAQTLLGSFYGTLQNLQDLAKLQGIQLKMPSKIDIE